jgi:DNA-binding NtrC family response regulator
MLVGDRFVRERSTSWRDLATGDAVAVRVLPLSADWTPLERSLLEEFVAAASMFPLVDFGLVGRSAWFEARAVARDGSHATPRSESAHHVAERLSALATAWDRGVHFVRMPTTGAESARAAAGAAARRLRPLGFVTIRAGVQLPESVAAMLAHRHVTVLLCDASDCAWAASWVRRLAHASPRAHLVADLTSDAALDPGVVLRLHERAAESLTRRLPIRRWDSPRPSPRKRPTDPAAGDTSIARVRACLLRGDLAIAESMLAKERALADASGSRLPVAVRLLEGELRFWQGRFEHAAALCRDTPADADRVGHGESDADVLRGLVAWANGQIADVSRAVALLEARAQRTRAATAWCAALRALAASLQGDAVEVRRAVGRVIADPGTGPRSAPFLARAAAAEALRTVGDSAAARSLLNPHLWARAPALYRLLADSIREADRTDSASAVAARVNRAGAHGVRRWGSRTMHLLHALPTMLQLVHDAEDELAALAGSCAWLRRHCSASAVAILSADGQVVTGDGWPAAAHDVTAVGDPMDVTAPGVLPVPGAVLAVAPVRYASRPIGLVVVRGTPEMSATWTQAAATLAVIGAPALRARLDAMAIAHDSRSATPEILGRSPAMVAVREAVARAAVAPFPVLVEGESGTGKELVARALHRLSARRDRRFSAVNCAALGDDLIEAELFGHARGAFTGAVGPRAGLFEDAHGGTLMLDEVSELSPRAQAKLLRVLQEREVRRVGENAARPVDVRLVAATNRPLGALVARRRFREDLLFRLAVIRLRLPPLRDRIEDVPLLVHACWRELTRQAGKRALLAPDAVAALCRHAWPGNVRELQNVVAALVVEAPVRGRTGARAVEAVLAASGPDRVPRAVSLVHARLTCERHTIASALARHAGRRAAAARELGLTRQGLAKAIKRLGLAAAADQEGVA